jgi:sec-independent protein translocase protein TatB
MMPGVGFEEMILLVVVAIIIVGPKDLPLMMRKFGRFTGKMRAMAFEFKQGIDELGRQAELDELRKEVANLKASTGLEDLKKDLEDDRVNLEKDVNSALAPTTDTPAVTATHPALNGAAAALPVVAPYAGLSPEHPGYDTGEDFRIDGGSPETPNDEPLNGELMNGAHANGVHVNGDEPGAPHIIPDDHVAEPEPVKQDTPA